MSTLTRVGIRAVLLASFCLEGCSMVASEENVPPPDIQGVWRYSEVLGQALQRSITFEFTQDRFTVSGYPGFFARGTYLSSGNKDGSYRLTLKKEESKGFSTDTVQVSPTNGKSLLIDRRLFRRILRQ